MGRRGYRLSALLLTEATRAGQQQQQGSRLVPQVPQVPLVLVLAPLQELPLVVVRLVLVRPRQSRMRTWATSSTAWALREASK